MTDDGLKRQPDTTSGVDVMSRLSSQHVGNWKNLANSLVSASAGRCLVS